MEASGAKFLLFLVVAIAVALKNVAKRPAKEARDYADEQRRRGPKTSEETSPIRTVRAQKRGQPARAEQWAAAKRQQDDAQQLHSIKMDTCESRLDSLRVLYEAGILDREEYAQRVSRVKKNHREA